MKFMKNGILGLLLMSSAASAKVTITPHKDRTKAELAAEYSKFRILAKASSLVDNADSKAEWKLRQVEFFKSGKCTGKPISAEPSKFTSSYDNVNVGSLFDRDPSDVVKIGPNRADNYWVGFSAANAKSLGCVKVKQTANNRMRGFKVQVGDGEGNYKTLYTVSDIDGGEGTFKLLKAKTSKSTKSASPSTSASPSMAPSMAPGSFSCDEGDKIVEVKINTDAKRQIYWKIYDGCSMESDMDFGSDSVTGEDDIKYSKVLCVPGGGGYVFTIADFDPETESGYVLPSVGKVDYSVSYRGQPVIESGVAAGTLSYTSVFFGNNECSP